MDLPKHVQDKLAQFQNLQNQVQVVSVQKQQLMLNRAETDNALQELGSVGTERVFRMIGPLLIETNRDDGLRYLTNEKESSETKIRLLENQEKKMVEKLNEMRGEIQGMLQPKGAG